MAIKVKSYKSESSLISSIIYFILGGILLTKAEEVLSILSLAIGIILIVGAIIALTIYYISSKKEEEKTNKRNLIVGIILFLFAIIFIFFSNIVAEFIRFIVGGWILFTGIMRLINALSMNNKNTKFIPLLIVSVLLIGIGIFTIVKGDILLETVGLIMMIYAAVEILGFVFYSKDTLEKESEGATTLIVPEEEIKKEPKTKVKDIKEQKKRKKKDSE